MKDVKEELNTAEEQLKKLAESYQTLQGQLDQIKTRAIQVSGKIEAFKALLADDSEKKVEVKEVVSTTDKLND